jgi:hypothetical protein
VFSKKIPFFERTLSKISPKQRRLVRYNEQAFFYLRNWCLGVLKLLVSFKLVAERQDENSVQQFGGMSIALITFEEVKCTDMLHIRLKRITV